jgi:hypothetical protein
MTKIREVNRIKKQLLAYFKRLGYSKLPINDLYSIEEVTKLGEYLSIEDDNFIITEYNISNNKIWVTSSHLIIKNDKEILKLPIIYIRYIFLNNQFKLNTTLKQLHIVCSSIEYVIHFSDLLLLARVRDELHKIISCIIEEWEGKTFNLNTFREKTEVNEIY